MNTFTSLIALVSGFFLDLLIGDPYILPHPVRAIGTLITKTEHFLRTLLLKNGKKSPKLEFLAGMVLWLFIVSVSTLVPLLLLTICYKLQILLGTAVESILCYYMLAAKSLKTESEKVAAALEKDDTESARYAVSMIVGRDTKPLSKEGIAKAAVETVAENTSDGVAAPFLFMLFFGAPGGFFYKAANTLDSMVGYRREAYLFFGRFSARADDVLNFIPSRISALLMLVSVWFLEWTNRWACSPIPWSFRNALRIFLRDRYHHKSPNSAQTEAVCAGAMQITLAGPAWYFGELYEKPYIGDGSYPVTWQHIRASSKLLYGTAWLCLIIGIGIRLLLLFFF